MTWAQHYDLRNKSATGDISSPNGFQFMYWLYQFRSIILVISKESSRNWAKCLGPCYLYGISEKKIPVSRLLAGPAPATTVLWGLNQQMKTSFLSHSNVEERKEERRQASL